MRPLLTLILVGVILGGMQVYMTFRPQPEASSTPAELLASGVFQLEITLTFAAGADPFALDVSDAPSLLVSFRGQDLLRVSQEIEAGETVRVDQIDGVVTGANEFFVQASPRDQQATAARAIRVRVLQDGNPVAEESLWAEPGELVEGVVAVDVRVAAAGKTSDQTQLEEDVASDDL
jgi:hypothetical protein